MDSHSAGEITVFVLRSVVPSSDVRGMLSWRPPRRNWAEELDREGPARHNSATATPLRMTNVGIYSKIFLISDCKNIYDTYGK